MKRGKQEREVTKQQLRLSRIQSIALAALVRIELSYLALRSSHGLQLPRIVEKIRAPTSQSSTRLVSRRGRNRAGVTPPSKIVVLLHAEAGACVGLRFAGGRRGHVAPPAVEGAGLHGRGLRRFERGGGALLGRLLWCGRRRRVWCRPCVVAAPSVHVVERAER